MFDAIVISGEVGMRKPEPEIFAHALELLGVAADETVFVDDLRVNVDRGGRASDSSACTTSPMTRPLPSWKRLFGVPLRE